MSDNFQIRIETTQPGERHMFVDKYDDGEVWISIGVSGGGANCTITFDQAKQMIAALQAILDNEPLPQEEDHEVCVEED